MADFAIGDIQGCYDPLRRLLDQLDFNEHRDRLWLVGDLVNRGPDSLAVIQFLRQLPRKPLITLGNHDLYLLSRIFIPELRPNNPDDTLDDILNAPDRMAIGHWLRQQPLLVHDEDLQVVMAHAGIAPLWTLQQAKDCATELESALQSENYLNFLQHLFGNEPHQWSSSLEGMDRLRIICNYFTRMRCCDSTGGLVHHFKGSLSQLHSGLYPWYTVPDRIDIPCDIIFGHWAALNGKCPHPRIFALDTGCVWGGSLTALRLQDRQRFSVENKG